MSKWDWIREHFDDAEKAALNAAITGETICPRGCVLAEEKLGPALTAKLKELTK